jgi:hypothetical protein
MRQLPELVVGTHVKLGKDVVIEGYRYRVESIKTTYMPPPAIRLSLDLELIGPVSPESEVNYDG